MMKPVGVNPYCDGTPNNARVIRSDNNLLIGKDNNAPKNQLIQPMPTPSTNTIFIKIVSEAPIERMTPISRVRSITFMLIVPANPMLPTKAVRIARISKKLVRMAKEAAEESLILFPVDKSLTRMLLASNNP